jgi:SAM-dependent methyltransferase
LYSGIPKESDYKELITSRNYLDLNDFSAQFLEKNKSHLSSYASKWVSNPLRQWSRKWEYPYVFDRVSSVLDKKDSAVILDAGSGVSFSPYYILSKYPGASIHCADYDPKLSDIYAGINQKSERKVEFKISDLRELEYPDGMFDLIYCISVLEHTDSYPEIIRGFSRLLAHEGKLVVTFDVSLDGKRDVSPDKARELVNTLARNLSVDEGPVTEIDVAPGSLTTLVARELDPDCLPWKAPAWLYRIQSLVKGKGVVSWPPPLTVFCLSLTKKNNIDQ